MKRLGYKGIVLALALCAGLMFSGCKMSEFFNTTNADKVTATAPTVEATASAMIAQADSLASAVENSTGKSIDAETAEKLQAAAEKVSSVANVATALVSAASSATGTTDNSYVNAFNAALLALGGVAGSLVTFFKNRNKVNAAITAGNVSTDNEKKEN